MRYPTGGMEGAVVALSTTAEAYPAVRDAATAAVWRNVSSARQGGEQAVEVVLVVPAAEGGAYELLAGDRADDHAGRSEQLDDGGRVAFVPGDEGRAVTWKHLAAGGDERVHS